MKRSGDEGGGTLRSGVCRNAVGLEPAHAENQSAARTMPRLRLTTMNCDEKIAAHDKCDGTCSCSTRLSYLLATDGIRTGTRRALSAARTMPRLRLTRMNCDEKIANHDKSDGTFFLLYQTELLSCDGRDSNPRPGNHVVPSAFVADEDEASESFQTLSSRAQRGICLRSKNRSLAALGMTTMQTGDDRDKSEGTSCSNRLSYRLSTGGTRTRDPEINSL